LKFKRDQWLWKGASTPQSERNKAGNKNRKRLYSPDARQTFTLSEYPFALVELACEACERRGRLRTARLVEQYGADYGVGAITRDADQ
jgi:hypothetical protein